MGCCVVNETVFFSKTFFKHKYAGWVDVGYSCVVMLNVGVAQFLKAKIHYG